MNAPTKAEVRRSIRAGRAALSRQELTRRAESLASALARHIPPQAVVAGYLPMPGEPDLLPFLELHTARRGPVYLPVVPPTGKHLEWSAWAPGAPVRQHPRLPVTEPDPELTGSVCLEVVIGRVAKARKDAQGVEEPPAEQASQGPAHLVFLVPALAVDTSGARLGQGGGYYDTSLAPLTGLLEQHPGLRCEVIAVVHSHEVLEPGSFPVQPHDLRAPRVATEYRVVGM
ncbi:5-formyltetrahydrofolate cyclo-ligase [Nesterenkonia muleiensis]|uniref:5-formyltetrahydrofolate cyclo-ligase n=1 Tax=Nesterenkonia muleiensis TaxID=2282648 RepID=UPI000E74E342|nr:5-formyltetrahydrofolate cyclo-ligase [Nesterenkonia muleiensis]